MKRLVAVLLFTTAVALRLGSALAVEIKGRIVDVRDDVVKIVTDSQDLPNPGDPVEVYFAIPGLDDLALVGSGKVTDGGPDAILAKIERGAAKVAKDQIVKIVSDNPRRKPRVRESMVGWKIDFDGLPRGALAPGALARAGIRAIESPHGKPLVTPPNRSMVLPAGRKQLLLNVWQGGESRLTLTFSQPVNGFGLLRAGAAPGASFAPWRLQAMDLSTVVDSVGEDQRVTDPKPKSFSVGGSHITRVELVTRNTLGAPDQATQTSLPVVEFSLMQIERTPVPSPAPGKNP